MICSDWQKVHTDEWERWLSEGVHVNCTDVHDDKLDSGVLISFFYFLIDRMFSRAAIWSARKKIWTKIMIFHFLLKRFPAVYESHCSLHCALTMSNQRFRFDTMRYSKWMCQLKTVHFLSPDEMLWHGVALTAVHRRLELTDFLRNDEEVHLLLLLFLL